MSCFLYALLLEVFATPSFLRKRYTIIHPPSRRPTNPFQKDFTRPPSRIIRTISTSASRNSKSYGPDIQDTKLTDIQLKRAQIEEKYINAKNRLDFNRRRNNLAGDRLKQDQQEVALFLEKLREVRTLEREYFQLNPEQNEMESDEIYDTTDSEIQMNLSNDANDANEDEKPDRDEVSETKEDFDSKPDRDKVSETKEDFDSKQTESNSIEHEQSSLAPSSVKKRILFKSDAMGKVQRTLVKYERKVSKLGNEPQSSPLETQKSSIASPPKQYRSVYKQNKGSSRCFVRFRPLRRSSEAVFAIRAILSRDRSVRKMPAFCRERRASVFCELSM